jgi:hypothetical protein
MISIQSPSDWGSVIPWLCGKHCILQPNDFSKLIVPKESQRTMRMHKMPDFGGYLLTLLREHIGSTEAIGAMDLALKVSAYSGETVDSRQVRQAVHDLRISGQPVCSGAGGFFWPASLQDVLVCADTEFRSEARSMLLVARKLRQAGRVLFGGQARLL